MGCGGSKERPLNAIDSKLVKAVVDAKRRAGRTKVTSFDQIMLQMPILKKGFVKCREYFATMDTDHTGRIGYTQFREQCSKIGLDPNHPMLKEVFETADLDGSHTIEKPELSIIFTIMYLVDSSDNTYIHPNIVSALDLVEKAFIFFDCTADGFLERKEVFSALKEGRSSKGRSNNSAARTLFDSLDWDKSGNVSFKEFLLGLERMVMEGEDDEEKET